MDSTQATAQYANTDDAPGTLVGMAEACRRHMRRVKVALAALGAFPGALPPTWQRKQEQESIQPLNDATSPGEVVLRMIVLRGGIASLMTHAALVGWLARHHPEALAAFQAAVELDGVRG
jgi:hypothetical protein